MFYNVGGGWNYSQFPGAWMIRPVLRTTPIISSVNTEISQNEIKIFPNPFSDFTTILLNSEGKNTIQLFDISGRLLSEFVVNENSFQFFKNTFLILNLKGVFRKKLVIQ